MPSLIGSTVTANYLKAAPSTQFGTRQLAVIKVAQAGVFVSHASANSLFSKSVRALQQTAEVYAVFTPVDDSTDYFHAIIAADTQSTADSATDATAGFGLLETAIAAGNGGTAATVTTNLTGFVAPANYAAV
jgi:hypothetical protein